MATMQTTIPVSDLTKNLMCEITLTGIKVWKARLSVGIVLFKFAAWVTGMNGTVKVGESALGKMEKKGRSAAVLSRDQLGEITERFGLKHVRHLTIDIPREGIVTVTAEVYPEIDGVKQLLTTLKKYRLEEV